MYGIERKSAILELLKKNARVDVQELSEHFDLSESTIRRDLKELEEAQLLKRTHGGAVLFKSVTFEPTYIEKEVQFQKEKRAIAKEAAKLIKNGESILLDSGTTTYYLAQELRNFSSLQVVTNSILCANELKDVSGIDVLLCGGSLRWETLALVGPLAELSFNQICVDKSFIATNGVDIENGLTTPNLIEASTKRKMIECAEKVILVTDHTKIGQVSFARFGDIHEIDYLITDRAAQENVLNRIGESGVFVNVV
ncbi:DeoR/GlpR family DNA-binding transcription regulator [Fictibacillus enclensis]|uniref:DeoR/GlpR family DNA-binding transcription regulator n=1 Tax=Fictibacillus enclensis TaxID=1017270 RepID=UPI0024BF9728|nr:DeoR/GlpR family DNA-binding transcription regulator [Fictibacillus enclensis]WHY72853.1 DeoR/GlpR family DNA-binding transcription regulator [Fictibacillus enclensis]